MTATDAPTEVAIVHVTSFLDTRRDLVDAVFEATA